MNEREAKQQLIYLKNDLEGLKYNSCASKRMEEALNKAIKALEKQIPKKPNRHEEEITEDYVALEYYSCPNCGNNELSDTYDFYCFKCGQCIDWTVEE